MDKEFDHLLRSNQATIAPPNPPQAAVSVLPWRKTRQVMCLNFQIG